MRIAIVGAGISGLGCAWLLDQRHAITLYEAAPRLGGHSNTVDVRHHGRSMPVDTGFIVYNEQNYPDLTRLFRTLGVPTHGSDMSFGVSIDRGRLEYCGNSPTALFAQTGNVLRLDFHRMLLDVLRFNREGARALANGLDETTSLVAFLDRHDFCEPFRRCYLLPMGAAIWSGTIADMLDFPAKSFLRFFANHGLLSVNGQPDWRTVTGGARVYVERLRACLSGTIRPDTPVRAVRRLPDGVEVIDADGGCARFDQVVLACHADQVLALIERPSAAERAVLGAFHYRVNHAVLHQDPALMPRRRGAWASWNYLTDRPVDDRAQVSVTYWMNRLQGIDPACPLFLSLNPLFEPAPERVLARFVYTHPQFTRETLGAQARRADIQGRDRLWFAGAHWGYGFHEDGLRSGLEVAAALGTPAPWWPRRHYPEPAAAWTLPQQAAAKPE
jgi:predicted NAD/FAD-binding protein